MRTTLFILALLCVGCGPPQECVRFHLIAHPAVEEHDTLVYWPSTGGGAGLGITPYGVGVHIGGGLHIIHVPASNAWTEQRCDEWRPLTSMK